MNGPRFTVAVFVQDAELHLARALHSALGDRAASLELIAVDAGSRDDSGGQLREWAEEDARVRVVTLGRCAQAEAFNVAISLAQGARIGFLDARDWLPAGALGALAGAPEADVVVGGAHQEGAAALIRARHRAWGVWFRVALLRNTGARLGAQSVDLDLQLMIEALEAAGTIAHLQPPLLNRGTPSDRVGNPPVLEVVEERLGNVRRLLARAPSPAHLQAACDEALELTQVIATLQKEGRSAHAGALRDLMSSALGSRWRWIEARGQVESAYSRARGLFSKDEG